MLFLVFGAILLSDVQVVSASPEYKPVSGFELSRYLGKWYEIATPSVSIRKRTGKCHRHI